MSNPAADYPADLHTPTDVGSLANSKLGATSPTHTQVHGKVEQEIYEIQKKLGKGSSDASAATAGDVLTRQSDGSTEWQAPEGGPGGGNISDTDATDLTDGGDTELHYHLSDRDVKPRLQGGVPYRQTQLDAWFAALATATKASPIDVVVIGDSLHALGTVNLPSVPGLFEQALNQQLGVADTSIVPIGVYAQADYSPTATSTQGTVTATSLGGFGSALSNGQILTHTATCVGFSVAYRTDPSYGTITIRDGAGGTVLATINCATTTKSGRVWHSGALSAGSHTLHITSSGNTVVEIIHPNYGHKVRVWNCAHSGYRSNQYTSNSYLALDLIDTLETAGSLKLVIIATGANDDGGSGYATDVPALIAAVDSHTTANLVLWFPYISGALPLAEYTAARTAAYNTGLPIIDSSVVAANALGLDGTHPDTWQKRMLALQETAVLGGDPFGTIIRQLHDTNRGGLLIPSPDGPGPEIGSVSSYLAPFGSMPGAGWAVGDGSAAFGDTNIARKSAKRWSLNNGEGTVEGNLSPALNAQTGTSYTLVLADAGKTITRSNASASTQTLPQNSDAAIPIGTMIHIINLGAGVVTFAAGTGASISGLPSLTQNQHALMTKTGTNSWNIALFAIGDPVLKTGGVMTGGLTTRVATSGELKMGVDGSSEEVMQLFKAVGDANPILSIGQLFTTPIIGYGLGGASVMDTLLLRLGSGQLAINTNTGGKGTLVANIAPLINAQTGTTYTVALDDAGKHITRSNASASTQDLPSNATAAIPIGTIIPITNIGAGAVTFQAGSGATITGATVLTQHRRGLMTKVSTNGWNIAVIPNAGSLTTSDFASNVVDTDTSLAANSDTRIPSQKAIKAYADQLLAANDAMVFKGVIDASANPNYPAADRGHSYKISVAGKIGGASGTNVEAGDLIICITDSTAAGDQATVGANWVVAQTNLDGAVTGPASATSANIATFNGASGKIIQDSGLSLDTDGIMAADSNTKIPSQKAVKSTTAIIQPTTGDYYSMGGQSAATTPGLTAAGKIIFHPIWLAAGTLDRIAVSTSVAAVSTYRLGLYKSNPATGLPDGQTPFLDAGTVDMNASAGVQAITINQAITDPGLYWVAVLVDAYTAQPTCHCVIYSSNSGGGITGLPQDMSSLGRYRVARVYNSTVATGSLPTAPSSSMTWVGTAPRVAVRYA